MSSHIPGASLIRGDRLTVSPLGAQVVYHAPGGEERLGDVTGICYRQYPYPATWVVRVRSFNGERIEEVELSQVSILKRR